MIASWMAYCLLCALWLALAAVLVERGLLRGRVPVRFVWMAGILLSLLIPAAAFRRARNESRFVSAPVALPQRPSVEMMVPVIVDHATTAITPVPAAAPSAPWRARLTRAEIPLRFAWLISSALAALYLAGGMIGIAMTRTRWRSTVLLDMPVMVSDRVGPAVIGARSPVIVVPSWALALDEAQLALILRHEAEHIRGGDSFLLMAAQLALILMPWNVALWWQVARLRAAIEFDCDSRVLRHVDVREYGTLLLDVVIPRRAPLARIPGTIAFADRARLLERRLVVMARRGTDGGRKKLRVTAAALIGLAAIGAACGAPRPAVDPKPEVPPAPAIPQTSPAPPTAIVQPTAPPTPRSVTVAAPVVEPVPVVAVPAPVTPVATRSNLDVAFNRANASGPLRFNRGARQNTLRFYLSHQPPTTPVAPVPATGAGRSIGCEARKLDVVIPRLVIVIPDSQTKHFSIDVTVRAAPKDGPFSIAYSRSVTDPESVRCTAATGASEMRFSGQELSVSGAVFNITSEWIVNVLLVDTSGNPVEPFNYRLASGDTMKGVFKSRPGGMNQAPGAGTVNFSWP